MRRREFITLLVSTGAVWPLAARAQKPGKPVIGFLHPSRPDRLTVQLAAFHQGLRELDFAEGRNLAIEYRWANDQYERLPGLAAELVQRRVAVIVVPAGTSAVLAAKAATKEIPIVFNLGSDPVDIGLVTSLSRPGGNITGVSQLYYAITAKRLELLRDLLPKASIIGLLVNPENSYAGREIDVVKATVRTLGLQLVIVNAVKESDIDKAFTTLVQKRADALLVGADVIFISWRDRFVTLAGQHRLPISYGYREFPAAGGLMSYGTNRADAYRHVGIYTGRILKGERPADLPVHQPVKFELVINLKAAKAIGLDVPTSLLLRADEVIE
jgi:putative ABC transport system substrate-binding protein